MTRRGKKYREAVKELDKTKLYSPEEAVSLAKKMSHASYDETVELHMRMGLDPRNATQQVRGVTLMPHGLGKPTRVLVFAQGEAEKIASEAGADYVGSDDLVKKVEEGWLDMDVTRAIAREYLGPLKRKNIDSVIMGCTHYPLLKPVIRDVLGKGVALVDSAAQTAKTVSRIICDENIYSRRKGNGRYRFYVTDETELFRKIGTRFLGECISNIKKVDLEG